MESGYIYIEKEFRKLGLYPIPRKYIDEIYLNLMQLTKYELQQFYKIKDLNISAKIVLKYIITHNGGNLLFEILKK